MSHPRISKIIGNIQVNEITKRAPRLTNFAATVRNKFIIKQLKQNQDLNKNVYIKIDRSNIFFVPNLQAEDPKNPKQHKIRTSSIDKDKLSLAEQKFLSKYEALNKRRQEQLRFQPIIMDTSKPPNKSVIFDDDTFQTFHVTQVCCTQENKFFTATKNPQPQQRDASTTTFQQQKIQIQVPKLKVGRLIRQFSKSFIPEICTNHQNNSIKKSLPNNQPIQIDLNTLKTYLKPRYQSIQSERLDYYQKKHGHFQKNKLFKQQLEAAESQSYTTREKYRQLDKITEQQNENSKHSRKQNFSVGTLVTTPGIKIQTQIEQLGWEKSRIGNESGEIGDYIKSLKFK